MKNPRSKNVIERITLHTLRIPIELSRVNCPQFASETLQRGPTGAMDGPWFANVPLTVAHIQGSGQGGWADLSRGQDIEQIVPQARQFIGLSPDDIHADRAPIADPAMQRGLHTAALDWAARIKGVPLHAMFGRQIRKGIKVAHWSGHRTPQGVAQLVREAVAAGVYCLKLKSNMASDGGGITAAVKRVVEELKPNQPFELVIDPNGRWDTFEQALPRAQAIADAGYDHVMLEDPLYAQNANMARIAQITGLPMIRTVIGRKGVIDGMVSTPVGFNLAGSWHELIEASEEVHKRGLAFWAGSSVNTGLFDMATVHFGVTQPAFTMAAELAGTQVREHSLLREPVRIENGVAFPGEGPGLGHEVDLDALEKYTLSPPVVVD